MYNLIGPGRSLFLVRPDEEPHGTFPFSFADEISSEWWDDDGGEEWQAMKQRAAAGVTRAVAVEAVPTRWRL